MTEQIKVEYLDHMGSDLDVANAARVSFKAHSHGEIDAISGMQLGAPTASDKALIQFLARGMTGREYADLLWKITEASAPEDVEHLINQYRRTPTHRSPFNHCYAKFRVSAPITVARQLVKHEYLPWNEVSRRYVTDDLEVFEPKIWRAAAANVKQGSSSEEVEHVWAVQWQYRDATTDAVKAYRDMTEDDGVCPELARGVLPQHLMTTWIWSGSLGAFAKMCVLRLDDHAQEESTEVARQINDVMGGLFPTSWTALMKYGV